MRTFRLGPVLARISQQPGRYLVAYWIAMAALTTLLLVPRSHQTSRHQPGLHIFMNTRFAPALARTSFPSGARPLFCILDMHGKAVGSVVDFAWIRLADGKKLFDFTGTYDPALSRLDSRWYYSWYNGPFAQGRYRCQVQINADTFGSTTFAVR